LKIDYVLVDFENIQPNDLGLLKGGAYRIKVFVGANQTKIPLEMARALQTFGPDAEYIRIEGSGANALDFHIAYYIGRLTAENPGAGFLVVSKDRGFDPLIKHLGVRNVRCRRATLIADIPVADAPASAPRAERLGFVIDNLSKRKAGRPRTLKTLRNTIKAIFADQILDGELDGVIAELTNSGLIAIADGKVHYKLPE
jgi:hypothetical protein